MPNTVLLVEDDTSHLVRWTEALEHRCMVITAATVAAGWKKFLEHYLQVDVVVLDGAVPSGDSHNHSATTLPLIKKIRGTGFNGPLIAASGWDQLQFSLLQAGCDYSANKDTVPEVVFAAIEEMDTLNWTGHAMVTEMKERFRDHVGDYDWADADFEQFEKVLRGGAFVDLGAFERFLAAIPRGDAFHKHLLRSPTDNFGEYVTWVLEGE